MMRVLSLLVAVAVTLAQAPVIPAEIRAAADAITAEQLARDLAFFASDELRGRNTPSPGFDRAAAHIVERLAKAGLKPLGDDGTYLQHYVMRESRLVAEDARVEIGERELRFGEGFSLHSLAAPVIGTFPVVYVGHGWTVPAEGIDAFAGLDVKGKVVVADGPGVMPKGVEIRQIGRVTVGAVPVLERAARAGAVAVIFVPGGEAEAKPDPSRGGNPTRRELEPSVPSAYAAPPLTSIRVSSRAAADAATIRLNLPVTSVDHRPYNVIGMIEGTDARLKEEYVTVQAHLDGAVGTRAVDGDDIYNAADDNASGSAGNLAIAEQMVKARPKRSIIFIWDSGEEQGLWGTRFFVSRPPVPLERIVAHFNIDMIGATSPDSTGPNEVHVIGPGVLSDSLKAFLDRVNAGYLNMTFNRSWDQPENQFFYPRTDAGPYLERGVLALTFFTGLHPRYHLPADEAKYLDPKKMEAVTRTVFAAVWALAKADVPPKIDRPIPSTVPRHR